MLTRRALFTLFQTKIIPIQVNVGLIPVVEVPMKIDNLTFELSDIPFKSFIQLFLNGLLVSEALDYTLSGSRIVFNSHYAGSDIIDVRAFYLRA